MEAKTYIKCPWCPPESQPVPLSRFPSHVRLNHSFEFCQVPGCRYCGRNLLQHCFALASTDTEFHRQHGWLYSMLTQKAFKSSNRRRNIMLWREDLLEHMEVKQIVQV